MPKSFFKQARIQSKFNKKYADDGLIAYEMGLLDWIELISVVKFVGVTSK